MKNILLPVLFLSLLCQTSLMAQDKATVKFQIKNFGLNVLGSFEEVRITPSIDLSQLNTSTLVSEIQVTSIKTGNGKRDTHLRSADYFEVETYPTIRLVAKKIIEISPGRYNMTGALTIKKTTKEVVIPLKITQQQNQLSLAAEFTINRRDFDVGGNSWVMGDIVKIKVTYQGENG